MHVCTTMSEIISIIKYVGCMKYCREHVDYKFVYIFSQFLREEVLTTYKFFTLSNFVLNVEITFHYTIYIVNKSAASAIYENHRPPRTAN